MHVSYQAVQIGSTDVTVGQLLGAAAVTGLLTFAAFAERKAIQRYVFPAMFYSIACRSIAVCLKQFFMPRKIFWVLHAQCIHQVGIPYMLTQPT